MIPLFMVDFLNIAPFDNGTERMSRLLLALLLYRSGYEVEQYSSIDAILFNTKGLPAQMTTHLLPPTC